jgi:hypothetical protein
VIRRLAVLLALGLAVTLGAPAPGDAQPFGVEVSRQGAPRLVLGGVLEGEGIRESLEAGLPVRVRVVAELWRDRWVDALEGRDEWRATIRLDPLSRRYQIEIVRDPGRTITTGDATSLAAVGVFLQGQLTSSLRPDREGQFYYLARLEVETLSLSDLDELRRWLNGDLGAAVDGRQDVGSAVGRGLRRLVVRTLGLPVVRVQARSPVFRFPR